MTAQPCQQPRPPIPAPLRGIEAGTFTEHSIVERLPEIGQRMLADNNFPQEIRARLQSFFDGIPSQPLRHLNDRHAPDAAAWAAYIAPYEGLDWLQAPWFFVETYFYRRILEAIDYFERGERSDPFHYQKQQGLAAGREMIEGLSSRVNVMLNQHGDDHDNLAQLLAVSLWGNQVDLSLWPAGGAEPPGHRDRGQQDAHTLVDHTGAVVDLLCRGDGSMRVDFIIDNAGFELVSDLHLALYLLERNIAGEVRLHLKGHPTFVSDAMAKDVKETIAFLENDPHAVIAEVGNWLALCAIEGRLVLDSDWFWTSPLAMWEMPGRLRRKLVTANLIISKGDANYRRLLGDRHWPFTTPFEDVVCYMPAPLVALRTSKSEVIAGLSPGQAEQTGAKDADWLTNGRWGQIQFATAHNHYRS